MFYLVMARIKSLLCNVSVILQNVILTVNTYICACILTREVLFLSLSLSLSLSL